MQKYRVAIFGTPDTGMRDLLRAVQGRFPVQFVQPTSAVDDGSLDGTITINDFDSPPPARPDCRLQLQVVRITRFDAQHDAARSRVVFSSDPFVDTRLRTQSLPSIPYVKPDSLPLIPGDRVLATLSGIPVWTIRDAGQRLVMACALPEISFGQAQNIDLLSGAGLSFVIVPLVQFLREVSKHSGMIPPASRGCFVIDDPNLRLDSYGSVHYRDLLLAARQDNFHVSIACVPLDLAVSARSVVRIFRRGEDHLSICLHGNNHTPNELCRTRGRRQGMRLMAQALRRSGRFSERFHFPVSPVVVPPHGTISRLMCVAAYRAGMSALCGDLWAYGHLVDPAAGTAGVAISDYTRDCMPIMRRHHLSESATALHLFLDHPAVQYLHHHDMADGGSSLRARAALINHLAPTRWMTLSAIARSNYTLLAGGESAVVHPHSVHCVVPAAQVGQRIVVEVPMASPGLLTAVSVNGQLLEVAASGETLRTESYVIGEHDSVYDIRLLYSGSTDPSTVEPPFPSPYYAIRRRLAEARDRLLPLLSSAAYRRL